LAVIGCGAPLGYGRGRFRRTAGWGRRPGGGSGVRREGCRPVPSRGRRGCRRWRWRQPSGVRRPRSRPSGRRSPASRPFRRFDVPHRIADHHARCVRRRAQLFQRHLQQVRCRLGRLDVGAAAGAGQHEPVTTFLDGYEQVAGTGQRRYLLEQRVDLLALLLPGLISHPVLQVLASDSREHLVPAHADQPIHRIGLAHRAQCPVPVNVEDGDGGVSHGRPLPAIPNRTVSELLCLVPRSRARTSRCGRRRPARTGGGRPDVAFSPRHAEKTQRHRIARTYAGRADATLPAGNS